MEGLSIPELLTQQFYQWEQRGRGWTVWPNAVELEPPFRSFRGHSIPEQSFIDDGSFETPLSRLAGAFKNLIGRGSEPPALSPLEEEEPEAVSVAPRNDLIELQVALPPDYRPLPAVFEQCLFSLRFCRSALSFEIVADKEQLVAQVVAERADAEQLFAQIKAHFPEASITPEEGFLLRQWAALDGTPAEIREFGLEHEFMLPLQSATQLATDPLVAICGALEYLGDQELGVFQVLFQPVRERWAESILKAVTTPDGDSFFENAPEILAQTKKKLARPLFAAVVRVGGRSPEEGRVWHIVKSIAGALSLFDNMSGNRLITLKNDDYPNTEHLQDLVARSSHRGGMIINSDELISLVHLPTAAVRSRKLKRETKRTKAVPGIATGAGVILGENLHEGKVTRVSLRPEQRMRHVHVIGTNGTGKSTLLLNMICQDIYQGSGVGVLDPHGDLIDLVLGYIPPERYNDVILFDASDSEYPIGFNILSAHSEQEKTLLASDLVSVFQRLSTSWGDQMSVVLGNAILAFLESTIGGTLADVRRFLIERPYRDEFLKSVQDPEVIYFWQQEFPLIKTNSLGPLLTRLNNFLRPKTVRYMVAQKESKIDFGAIMNEGKIFLARLPQGLIGEENAHLLGTLLVSKIHQLAIARQEMEASQRRPFFLFLDEFHHFATPTMATILTGVRKYQLSLVMAHHEIRQLQQSAELASAVLAQPYTRICFGVGSEDARKIAEGFSYFEAKDLQNLGRGEAICRVERSQFDFNLRTILPPEVDSAAAERRTYLRYLTRSNYGTPWQNVEAELAKSRFRPKEERVDPFTKRMAKQKGGAVPAETEQAPPEEEPPQNPVPEKPKTVDVPPPATVKPATTSSVIGKGAKPEERTTANTSPLVPAIVRPGRGGPLHQLKQHSIKDLAAGLGFVVDVEKAIPGGSVDIALTRGNVRIACEVSITTSPRHELQNLRTRFEAGFNVAIMILGDLEQTHRFKNAAEKFFTADEFAKTTFCVFEDVGPVLVEIAAKTPISETVRHGRRVTVRHDPRASSRTGEVKKTMLDTVARLIRSKKKK